VLSEAEIEERRLQKEKRRREEMERQAKEALFEEDLEWTGAGEAEYEDEEPPEDVIEL
jgi:hypothetical protein